MRFVEKFGLILLMAGLNASCLSPTSKSCAADSDCGADEACYAGSCSSLAAAEKGDAGGVESDGDADDGGNDGVDFTGDGGLCPSGTRHVLYGDQEGCLPECMNGQCATGSTCNSGVCVPSGKYVGLHIQYSTESSLDCVGEAPGPDILWVRLEDAGGNTLGWGSVFDQEIDGADNQYTSTAHLDGTAPADTAECPSLTSQDVVSLGCGWVALEFVDANGNPLRFSTGDVIVIGEYGPTCGESEREEFEARLCTQKNVDSCTRFHIGGAGVVSREVG